MMAVFRSLQLNLIGWPRMAKRLLMLSVDFLALPVLLLLAFMIRLDRGPFLPEDWWLLLAAPLVTIPMLYLIKFYRMVIRYLGSEMGYTIVVGMLLASMTLAALAYMVPAVATPRSVFIIYALLGMLYLGGSRFLARRYLLWASGKPIDRHLVVIYGAGGAGIQAASALINAGTYMPVAFVDDDPSRGGELLHGLPVLNRHGLIRLLKRREIFAVLLAMPSAARSQRMEVVRFLEPLGVKVKSVPALPDIIAGKARIEELRDVAIEELLGRDPVPPRQELLDRAVRGKNVLVTGAGGSIGSELCRQILTLAPKRLVLLEVSEIALYSIEQELRHLCGRCAVDFVAVLGCVTDRMLIASVLESNSVQTVYHAAAYKHVPIVEHNVCAGVRNNVIGTQVVAEESEKAGVERFTLVSTDKAVRPTNVMGASKRLAELVLQALSERGGRTIFTMVRFGNVLGSSGSVVPLFREQIRQGGPVTVTHPDVMRYFMTIPEASQLVIQAGAMAEGGEVFVLDMGEPVRIYDLACTMIHLMGMSLQDVSNPHGEIEIRITGLRAGEKLYEELLIGDDSSGTEHSAILRAHETMIPWGRLSTVLVNLLDLLQQRNDGEIRALLRSCVSGYRPVDADADADTDAATKTDSRPAVRLH